MSSNGPSDCCRPVAHPTLEGACPSCGNPGKPVQPVTLRALLQSHLQEQVRDESYRFCGSPACAVVYYLPGSSQIFAREALTVRVGVKETSAPHPLCYCFGHSEESLRETWLSTGKLTAVAAIQAAMKAGACRCEVTNPQGSCCLGDVLRAGQEIQASAFQPTPFGEVHC